MIPCPVCRLRIRDPELLIRHVAVVHADAIVEVLKGFGRDLAPTTSEVIDPAEEKDE